MHSIDTVPHLIQTPTFDNLPIEDLVPLRAVSKTTLASVESYYNITFCLDKLYAPFFSEQEDRTKLRKLLADAGALVTSFALIDILSRQPPRQSVLYIYTPAAHVSKKGKFLAELLYNFEPLPQKQVNDVKIPAQAPTFEDAVQIEHKRWFPNTGDLSNLCDDSTISGVFRFTKESNRVYLVGTRTEPAEVILTFHSTLFMNVATADQIVSLYPKTSFIEKRALIVSNLSPASRSVLQSFEADGWITFTTPSAIQSLDTSDELSFETRSVGDRHSWIIDFAPVSTDDTSYLSFKVTSWHLVSLRVDQSSLSFERLEHESLAKTYVLAWEANKAVLTHPCFFTISEKDSKTENTANVNNEEEAEPLDESKSDSSESSVRTTDSLLQAISADEAQYDYMVKCEPCKHKSIENNADLDQAVVEYLQGFYPLMGEAHKWNHDIRELREDLMTLENRFRGWPNQIDFPSAHAIHVVLQFVDYVRMARRRGTAKYHLEFTLNTATNRITTACIIKVPEDQIADVEADLTESSEWSEAQLTEAGVVIMVTT